jgi:tRNA (guanine37-N1)-methyltransferase
MKISFITLFPELIRHALEFGVTGQALKKGLFDLQLINPRDFTEDVHKTVDDRPFGGGDGMVLLAEPFEKALLSADGLQEALIVLSRDLSEEKHILWVCSRYSGLDERWIKKYVHREVSLGDFVTSGGEFPALAMTDSLLRHVPGVLGHEESHIKESFAFGGPLEAPLYTRPRQWQGLDVPAVLFSGDHKRIEAWRRDVGLVETWLKRPDWFTGDKEKIRNLRKGLKNLSEDKEPSNWPFEKRADEILREVQEPI